MLARTPLAALMALIAIACPPPAALATDARYEGISVDGEVAFFSTTDKLVPGDTDARRDIYERSFDEAVGGNVTRQVSFGPTGGNNAFDPQYLAADDAGGLVFFSTDERLNGEDKDGATDIYVRDLVANKTALVSAGDASCAGSGCGNANSDAGAVSGGVVADGAIVFFASLERLAAEDVDSSADVYVRDLAAKTTTLVSAGDASCAGSGCGDGPPPAFFQGASALDGAKAFFTTTEALVAGDADGQLDIYQRDLVAEETRIVSTTGTCPGAEVNCTPVFGGAAEDGSHVFFETKERIEAPDTDSAQDVYDWSEGPAVLASRGPGGFNGSVNALYAGSSPSGDTVFVETTEALTATDSDASQDVFERSAGETLLISRRAGSCDPVPCGPTNLDASVVRSGGVPSGIFDDGAKVFLFTKEKLAVEDSDESFDTYVRDRGEGLTTLVSRADSSCVTPGCGNGPHDANFSGASADGSRAFFVSDESLVPADTDTQTDVYRRAEGATSLISTGSINGNGLHDAQLQGLSADGSRAFFLTRERLTEEDDLQGEEDVYVRSTSGTLLVSRGNDAELESLLAPPPPLLERTDPASPNPSTEPKIVGTEAETAAAIKVYSTADCSGEPVATGSAEELAAPGIPVSVGVGSTTTFRATAEAEGFASACSGTSLTYAQQTPAPPPPPPGGGSDGTGSGSAGSGSSTGSSTQAPTHDGIAYVAPVTRITFGPAFKTRVRRPVFRFTDSTGQPDTKFLCRLDRQAWKSCGSPTRLKGLARGRHMFSVKGINAAGVAEEQPAKRRFKLVNGR